MNIYVGNLSREVTSEDLQEAFGAFGQVDKAIIITDKFSGEPRGFGFVEMANNDEAKAAIEALNGQDLKGRDLRVNEARPREDRPRRSFGGNGGSRGGFGGNGGNGGSRGGFGGNRGGFGENRGGNRGGW